MAIIDKGEARCTSRADIRGGAAIAVEVAAGDAAEGAAAVVGEGVAGLALRATDGLVALQAVTDTAEHTKIISAIGTASSGGEIGGAYQAAISIGITSGAVADVTVALADTCR